MSSFIIQPPDPFCFSSPNEWPKWRRRFERFYTTSGLSAKPEEHQVDALLYIMGDKAEDIFSTFELAPDEAKKFSIVMDRFEKYFIPRHNVIYERTRFNTKTLRRRFTHCPSIVSTAAFRSNWSVTA